MFEGTLSFRKFLLRMDRKLALSTHLDFACFHFDLGLSRSKWTNLFNIHACVDE